MHSRLLVEASSHPDVCPGSGQIQSVYLRGLKQLVQRMGGSYRSILERYDIDISAFEEPNYHLDAQVAVALLDDCSVMFDDQHFGLLLAEQQDPDVFGCITAVARAAPVFRTAIECYIEYVPLFSSPEGVLELVVAKERAELRWHSTSDTNVQANQHGLLLWVKTLRMRGGEEFKPTYATLHAKLSERQRNYAEARIGCRVRRSNSNAIGFSLDFLQRVNTSRNEMLYTVLRNYLDALKSERLSNTAEKVEHFIRNTLPKGRCSIEQCAGGMRIPVRTLQRRLTEERQSFSTLLNKQRLELAKQQLRHGKDALAQIALDLGYSDQTSFCRAFRRWTGLSPRSYRQIPG
jgi:AraC-like DNA-binding protein